MNNKKEAGDIGDNNRKQEELRIRIKKKVENIAN